MGTIKKHYDKELLKVKPNLYLLANLEKLIARKSITLNEWRNTGKFTPRLAYLKYNPDVVLLKSCTEVIEYVGMTYIQVLTTGVYRYTKSIRGKVLDNVEDSAWEQVAQELFCTECDNNSKKMNEV